MFIHNSVFFIIFKFSTIERFHLIEACMVYAHSVPHQVTGTIFNHITSHIWHSSHRSFFLDGPGKWATLTLSKQSGLDSLNWSRSSQRMWLITDQFSHWHLCQHWTRMGVHATQLSQDHSPHYFSKTVLMTFPLHVLFLCLQCSVYTAEDSLGVKTINYACH